MLCYNACNPQSRLGYDDSPDVGGVHGVGGTWGALTTGLFASAAVNDAGGNGLFFGNPGQIVVQIVSSLVTWIFAFVGSLVLLKIVDAVVGLRIHEEDEAAGLDHQPTQRERGRSGRSSGRPPGSTARAPRPRDTLLLQRVAPDGTLAVARRRVRGEIPHADARVSNDPSRGFLPETTGCASGPQRIEPGRPLTAEEARRMRSPPAPTA